MATGPAVLQFDAVRTARQRCWRYDWVLDIDVRDYFDISGDRAAFGSLPANAGLQHIANLWSRGCTIRAADVGHREEMVFLPLQRADLCVAMAPVAAGCLVVTATVSIAAQRLSGRNQGAPSG
jgi:hypothetical protein